MRVRIVCFLVVLLVSYLAGVPMALAEISMTTAVSRYPELVFDRGDPQPSVALTFDDGPDANYTPAILDILKEKQVKATFFVIGDKAEKYPDVIKRIVEDGHCLANHTWNHPYLPRLDSQDLVKQISYTEQLLANISGVQTKLLRPPYGSISDEAVAAANELGYKVILWSVDSNDWRGYPAQRVMENILRDTKPGAIILQHCGNQGTLNCLGTLIDTLRERGYNLVTVPQLLQTEPVQPTQPAKPIRLVVNGHQLDQFTVPPYQTEEGRVMIPIKAVLQALGKSVDFKQAEDTMLNIPGMLTMNFKMNDSLINVRQFGSKQENQIQTSEPITLKQDTLMMPVRSLAEIMGLDLDWEDETGTLSISKHSSKTWLLNS